VRLQSVVHEHVMGKEPFASYSGRLIVSQTTDFSPEIRSEFIGPEVAMTDTGDRRLYSRPNPETSTDCSPDYLPAKGAVVLKRTRMGRARTKPLQNSSSVPQATRRNGSEETGSHAAEPTAAGRTKATREDLRPVRNIARETSNGDAHLASISNLLCLLHLSYARKAR